MFNSKWHVSTLKIQYLYFAKRLPKAGNSNFDNIMAQGILEPFKSNQYNSTVTTAPAVPSTAGCLFFERELSLLSRASSRE